MLSLKEICILLYSLLEIIILLHMAFWNQCMLNMVQKLVEIEFIGGVLFYYNINRHQYWDFYFNRSRWVFWMLFVKSSQSFLIHHQVWRSLDEFEHNLNKKEMTYYCQEKYFWPFRILFTGNRDLWAGLTPSRKWSLLCQGGFESHLSYHSTHRTLIGTERIQLSKRIPTYTGKTGKKRIVLIKMSNFSIILEGF